MRGRPDLLRSWDLPSRALPGQLAGLLVAAVCLATGLTAWVSGSWPWRSNQLPTHHLKGPLRLQITFDLGNGDFRRVGLGCSGVEWVKGIGAGKTIQVVDLDSQRQLQAVILSSGQLTSDGGCAFQFQLNMPPRPAARS